MSPDTCQSLSVNEDLMVADPTHHKSSYFVIKNLALSVSYSDSENKHMKNFYRANYELINSQLDIDWDFLIKGTVDDSVENFCDVANEVIENKVPNLTSSPSQYPPWSLNQD